MRLDHATIVTNKLEAAQRVLCSVVGLKEGPRPPFGTKGHWLYADGQPVIHLIERAAATAEQPASARIDHVGLRIESGGEWLALLKRMEHCGAPYELCEVPLTGERQLFLAMAPGVVIELITNQSVATP